MEKLAERIKELRLSKEMTIMDLSKATGISKSSISRWENGQSDINGRNLIILAEYFDVTAGYILGIEDF